MAIKKQPPNDDPQDLDDDDDDLSSNPNERITRLVGKLKGARSYAKKTTEKVNTLQAELERATEELEALRQASSLKEKTLTTRLTELESQTQTLAQEKDALDRAIKATTRRQSVQQRVVKEFPEIQDLLFDDFILAGVDATPDDKLDEHLKRLHERELKRREATHESQRQQAREDAKGGTPTPPPLPQAAGNNGKVDLDTLSNQMNDKLRQYGVNSPEYATAMQQWQAAVMQESLTKKVQQ